MLPNLIIIGAQKAGTTSLHWYLMAHPQVWMSRDKELNFFIEERNWKRGVPWYETHFRSGVVVNGESSPSYTNFPFQKGVPKRMHSVVPDAKLIFLARAPIDRIVSHYVTFAELGLERRPFEEAVFASPDNIYVARSKYYMQVEQFLEFYPRSQLLIRTQDDLQKRRSETLREVFNFLGVDPSFQSNEFEVERHKSEGKRQRTATGDLIARYFGNKVVPILPPRLRSPFQRYLYLPFSRPIPKPVVSSSLRHRLAEVLEDDVRRFEELTGRKFDDWLPRKDPAPRAAE